MVGLVAESHRIDVNQIGGRTGFVTLLLQIDTWSCDEKFLQVKRRHQRWRRLLRTAVVPNPGPPEPLSGRF